MSVVWRKVWRDLAHNKTRTLLAILSTAVGVFALGLVFGLSGVIRMRMTEDHRASIPPHITFRGAGFDQQVVEAIQKEPGVADAETGTLTLFRWKREGETAWRDGLLIARPDYEAQRMDRIELVRGQWPDLDRRDLAVERQSARYFGVPLGSAVIVEFGRGERRLPVQGVVRSLTVWPPQFGGDATFYAAPETVNWLTGFDGFNQINVRLISFSEEEANTAAEQIEDRLDRMGRPAAGYFVTDPDVHPAQEIIDTLSLILLVLGTLALGLSAFLIINTMNAIVAQQVRQIGVMKVVGATSLRVLRIYLMMALIYGLLACVLAIPLSVFAAHGIGGFLLDLANIASGPLRVVPFAVAIQLVVGLAVPMLAALVPVIGGARITPHQAITSYGLGGGRFGRGWLDRLIARIRSLPRPLALSLRNTFRRKARLALTMLALTLGGVMFIVVISVGGSLNNTLEVLIQDFGLDVWVAFGRMYRTTRLIEIAESVPGVVTAEVWDQRAASILLASGEEREIDLWGVPPDSALFKPRIVQGRALLPEDGRAILLNNRIAVEEGVGLGDEIEISMDGRESAWTVVGVVFNVNNDQRGCFVPFDMLARETGNVDRGSVVMILSEQQDQVGEQALIRGLRDAYNARGLDPLRFLTVSELREQSRSQFNIITYLMLAMAILAALVGSLGLMGTMSINVVERSGEIGVMRAIGATSLAIARIVVVEGMLLALLSWLLALPISYPGARTFSDFVGNTLLNVPLDFDFSLSGVLVWLIIVMVLSALASLWPARRATQVSVREVLAYE